MDMNNIKRLNEKREKDYHQSEKVKLKTVIYNLILMLNDQFENWDIDNESFIEYVCDETGLNVNDYKKIMEV